MKRAFFCRWSKLLALMLALLLTPCACGQEARTEGEDPPDAEDTELLGSSATPDVSDAASDTPETPEGRETVSEPEPEPEPEPPILLLDKPDESAGDLVGTYACDSWCLDDGMCRNGSDGALCVSAEERTPSKCGYRSWVLEYQKPYRIYLGSAAAMVNGEDRGVIEVKLQDYNLRLSKDRGISEAEFILSDFPSRGDSIAIDLPLGTQTGTLYSRFDQGAHISWPSDGRIDKVERFTFRVLRWDESGEENCLVYAAIKLIYEGEEMEVELLLSAPFNGPDNMVLLDETEDGESSSTASSSGSTSGSGTYTPSYAKLDCLTCRGDGDCNTCNGYGEVRRYQGKGETVRAKCPTCYGSGKCRTCGGTGKRN